METIGFISIIIIIANLIVSYKGFSDRNFYARYSFEVEKILIYKDYKRLITSGFLHVNWMHLIFNMLALYFFSGSLESYIGPVYYLIIYFSSLIGGELLSLFIHKNQGDYGSVGASGAISGIIFASIALFPGMPIGMLFLPISLPAWLFGLLYILYSIYGIRSKRDNIGHDSHLGGGVIGMLIAIILYPSSLADNLLPILLIFVPAAVFIYIIITRPGFLLIDNYFFKNHNFYSVDHKYNYEKRQQQNELDDLLDKINKRGYNSLSSKEKERLKELSR